MSAESAYEGLLWGPGGGNQRLLGLIGGLTGASGGDGDATEGASMPGADRVPGGEAVPPSTELADAPAAAPAPEPDSEPSTLQGPDETRSAPSREPSSAAASSTLLVDDDAEAVGPNQMKKSEFLEALRPQVCAAVDRALSGTGMTSDGCPHVDYWFSRFASRDAAFMERML